MLAETLAALLPKLAQASVGDAVKAAVARLLAARRHTGLTHRLDAARISSTAFTD